MQTPLQNCVEILDHIRVPVNRDDRAKRAGTIPYFGATGQVGWIDDYIFDQELVLLGEDGAPFLDKSKTIAYIIRGKSWVNNHAHVLAARRSITTSLYMKYGLDNLDFRPHVNGTTRLKLTQASLRSIKIPLPPLAEQRRIVAEIEKQFTRLDAAVAALKRARANAKRYRASVLKAACEGHLVPTEADLARQQGRDYEPASKLLERILAERRTRWEADYLAKLRAKGKDPKDDKWKAKYKEPGSLDEHDLLPVPVGWVCATLSTTTRIQGGIQKQPKRRPRSNAYPFLRVANVLRDRLDLSEIHRIELFDGEPERYALQQGDLLIVEGNGSPTEIGRMAIWRGEIEDCVHQNHIIRSRPLHGVLSAFCAAYWNSPQGSTRVMNVAGSTSGLHTLSVTKIGSLPVPLPPLAEQHRIVADVERRLSRLDAVEAALEANLKRAGRLRQAILKRAFSGKLVPQDPNDEPAEKLLERIRAERATERPASKKLPRGRRMKKA